MTRSSGSEIRHCTVYQGRGEQVLSIDDTTPEGFLPHHEKTALHHIMSKDVVCARSDLELSAVVDLMVRHHIGCIPVVDDSRRPIGTISEIDVVEILGATMSSVVPGSALPPEIATKRADEVMMPIVVALDEYTAIPQAASKMMAEETHHVLAVSWEGALVGVVSEKDIVAWFLESEVPRPNVAPSFSTWRSLEG